MDMAKKNILTKNPKHKPTKASKTTKLTSANEVIGATCSSCIGEKMQIAMAKEVSILIELGTLGPLKTGHAMKNADTLTSTNKNIKIVCSLY